MYNPSITSKKVLLLANIGSSDEGYYHAGDEAMFLATYQWYRQKYPRDQLTAFTSLPNHSRLRLKEILNFKFPQQHYLKYAFWLVILCILQRIFTINILRPHELALVKLVSRQDIFHLTGGGNITTYFRHWMYYSLMLIMIAKLYGKKIYLTSQTVGPFFGIDKIIAPIILNLVNTINIREPKNNLRKLGIIFPKTNPTLDAAVWSSKSKVNISPKTAKIRIGLSLHSWRDYDQKLITAITTLIQKISQKYSVEFVPIPHIIIAQKLYTQGDMSFMSEIITQTKDKNLYNLKPLKPLENPKYEPAFVVKKITSTCDLVISTRYHGSVFALAENVPCLSFIVGPYYTRKNNGIYEFYYQDRKTKYLTDLNSNVDHITKSLLQKSSNIINHLRQEKIYLQKANTLLKNTPHLHFSKDLYEP